MKKFLLLLFSAALLGNTLPAQQCKCSEVKFTITKWVCKGKNAAGNPMYEGLLTIVNNSKCKFKLTEIMQQVGGDVAVALPISVGPGNSVTKTIFYTDVPPFAGAGSTPYFIVVFNLNDTKCKFEFPSEKLPKCPDKVCDCNPNGWQTVVATINNITQKVKCGHQFSLTCADKINLKSEYKCLGTCTAKYTAVLKNTATNTVVQNYPSFSFPWSYQFLTAGTYSLEITPTCGDKKCQSCRFFFTVKDCKEKCDCNPEGWQTFDAMINTALQKVKCGHQFGVKPNVPIKLNGKYLCKGNCTAKYVATLKNNVTNVVIQNYIPFNFPWTYSFAAEGNYKLEITPICGDKKCTPCVFYFTVKK